MPDTTVNIGGQSIDLQLMFSLPPKRAVEYLQKKNIRVDFDWKKADAEARAKAFSVAGVYKIDLLRDIKSLIDKGLNEGLAAEEIKKEARILIESRYLSGDEKITPAKIKNIYRQNIQTAYQAGAYKDLKDTAEQLPYWKYVAIKDNSTTAVCSKLDGTVLPADDPFWNEYYPPNHFGCRSTVIALSRAQAQEEGIAGKDQIKNIKKENPLPDGFNINVGETSMWDDKGSEEEVLNFSEASSLQIKPLQKTYSDRGMKSLVDMPINEHGYSPDFLKSGENDEDALKIISDAFGLSDEKPLVEIKTPLNTLLITSQNLGRINGGIERWSNYIFETLKNPYEIWATDYEDAMRIKYIGVFRDCAVYVRINVDGTLYATINSLVDTNSLRVGYLLYARDDNA